ncbi:MAG: zinc ribbon domain-containing protein [Patescibacteria group bacterium]
MIFRKEKEEKNIKEIGFEERERKTPFLGYLLLVAMVIVMLWLGFFALDDLYNVPKKPQNLSYCSDSYTIYKWEDAWRRNMEVLQKPDFSYPKFAPQSAGIQDECDFSDIEKEFEIPKIFSTTKALRMEILEIQNNLINQENILSSSREQYSLGLTERIAVEKQPLYSTEKIKIELSALEKDVAFLRVELDNKKREFKPFEEELRNLYSKIQEKQRSLWIWHDFYAFLLQIIFVFPLFFGLLSLYFKLSAKNSPYLIIATFMLIPASIFIIDITFVYFWGLFLGRILEEIWLFIRDIEILRSLLSYIGMILSALIFGGAVFFLQKRIFSPKRIALRHLRDQKCPNCSLSLYLSKQFCSNCGSEILIKCQMCGKERYKYLSTCQYCGNKE